MKNKLVAPIEPIYPSNLPFNILLGVAYGQSKAIIEDLIQGNKLHISFKKIECPGNSYYIYASNKETENVEARTKYNKALEKFRKDRIKYQIECKKQDILDLKKQLNKKDIK